MGREIHRVPLDFNWPLNQIWPGYLMPDRLREDDCPDCKGRGWSPYAQHLYDLWYGNAPFDPASTGSIPLRPDTPAVRRFAERNVGNAPDFYGTGEAAIVREAQRLADLWNGAWSHHLSQDDADALVAAGRLMDLTHTWTRETGWRKVEPPLAPTAEQVNEWSLRGLGHDAINAFVVIGARCQREDVEDKCRTCGGHGSIERYSGQREEAESWEREDPPTGEGWQLWETVSEGSPISPIFADAEGLAQWLTTPANSWGISKPMEIEAARRFVTAGWAPSMMSSAATGVIAGEEFMGRADA